LAHPGSSPDKNLHHNFPEIYKGGSGGERPLLHWERVDPAATEIQMRGESTPCFFELKQWVKNPLHFLCYIYKSMPSSSTLLLAVGGGLSINISITTIYIIKRSTSSPS
jgi:hypothetical protein